MAAGTARPPTPGWRGRLFASADTGDLSIGLDDSTWTKVARDREVLCDYIESKNATTYDVARQFVWRPDEHGAPSYVLRVVLSAMGGARARVTLHNLDTGVDVQLNASGDVDFVTTSGVPLEFTSGNLIGASGFDTKAAMYELRVSVSTTSESAILGGAEIVAVRAT